MRPLRIAQVGPVATSIPPPRSSSVELMTSLLTEGLVARGHQVTLFATGTSHTSGSLHATFPRGYADDSSLWPWEACELYNVAAAVERASAFDIIHCQAMYWPMALPFSRLSPTPLVQTLHHAPSAPEVALWSRYRDVPFIAISHEQARLLADCIQVTLQRYHLDPESIVLDPAPAPAPEGVPLRVLGIAEDLRTAIINVLDNAVKYSPEGVHVRCSLAIAHPSSVTLRIADRGIGLPENQNKRIFRRFYRVPGRPTAKIRGTGLGLFLVRNIVHQHGGDVKASSPGPGLGTVVTFTLPLAAPAANPEHP
jgi:anti-sigma regulatory factor (Ser/Thr protein kinase)